MATPTEIEIAYIKKALEEQKEDIKELSKLVNHLDKTLNEIKFGRKWLWGMLSASALVGALVDTLMRLLKVY